MKLIKTSNQKEIDWLLKEGHVVKNTDSDFKIFEVEEDVVVPSFLEPVPVAKNDKKKTIIPPVKKKSASKRK